MWKLGIMKDLYDAVLRGRLPLFVQGFLQNRQFQIRLGSHISDVFDQEMVFHKAAYSRYTVRTENQLYR